MRDDRHTTLNRWLVGTFAVFGVVLILVAGLRLEWRSVLVNFGSGFVVAAIIVSLEPRFRKSVKAGTLEALAPVKRDIEQIGELVQALSESTADLLSARNHETNLDLEAVEKSPTFHSVTRALEIANALRGLGDGIATVQGGVDPVDDDDDEQPLSTRVRFLWGNGLSDQEPSLLIQAVCSPNDRWLLLKQEPDTEEGSDVLCAETVWRPDDPAQNVGFNLITELQRQDFYRSEASLDWGKTILELVRVLRVVVESRQGSSSGWLIGQLFEIVGEDWAITTAGLEYKGRGIVCDADEWSIKGRDDWPPKLSEDVPPPDERLWRRADAYLPVRTIPPNTPSGWNAAIGPDDERHRL